MCYIKNMSATPKKTKFQDGNNFALKWKTSKKRKEICDKLCKHLAKGLSIQSFPPACFETIQSYITKFPKDFCKNKINSAKREGICFWERIGIQGTTGELKDFKCKSWQFNMCNRFPQAWKLSQTTEIVGQGLSVKVIDEKMDMKEALEAYKQTITGVDSKIKILNED